MAVVALSVALFGETAGAGFGESPRGACTVLTPDEIERALGARPSRGQASTVGDGVSICRWPSVTGESDLLYAIVAPRTARDRQELARSLAASFGEPGVFQDVEGLGDFAVWVSLHGEPAALQVYACDVLIQLGGGAGEAWGATAAKALASTAIARVCDRVSPRAFEGE